MEQKNKLGEVKRRLPTMNIIEKTSSWLFPHTICKGIYSFPPFTLTFILLLTYFEQYQHIHMNNTCSNVNDMAFK
jgi:hypothetical protein